MRFEEISSAASTWPTLPLMSMMRSLVPGKYSFARDSWIRAELCIWNSACVHMYHILSTTCLNMPCTPQMLHLIPTAMQSSATQTI